ncbi:MAG: hypothetical protein JXR22_13190 [Prolixibacteraceae bacterium]|nr:hypothetical protein [Prolixibacteraceae bacterium]
MKTKILLFSIIMVTSFMSCQKNEVNPHQILSRLNGNEELLVPVTATLVDEKSVIQSEDTDAIEAEEFAKLLASSINSKELRKFLKEEANKKFDGDFDILVSKIIDSKVGKESFKEKVENSSSHGSAKGKAVFESAMKNSKLNISVPLHIEKWDDTKQQLLVAVAVCAIEGDTKNLIAFDSQGHTYLIDANIEPDVPVIVVGNNERIGLKLTSSNDLKSMRVSGSYEHIGYLKCHDLGSIESWYLGGPEFRFDCILYNGSSVMNACGKIKNPSRSSAQDGYDPSLDLFRWYFTSGHGPDYFFQSWEIDDFGTTYKYLVKVSVPGVGEAGYEIAYKAQDKKLIGELINYQTEVPHYIEDDIMKFKFE